MSDKNGLPGYQTQESGGSEFNAQTFLIQQLITKVNTTALVKVIKVSNNDEVAPVGFVDVMPMVNQLDADGNPVPHGVIYNCCYMRAQGGINAVIIDPKVGDIGVCCFADRDISTIQNTKKPGNPGSGRRFSMADGIYLFGVLNGTPVQYVRFVDDGVTQSINVVSPAKVLVTAPEIDLNASTKLNITAADLFITAKTTHTGQVWMNGKRVDETHAHDKVQTGASNSGQVV